MTDSRSADLSRALSFLKSGNVAAAVAILNPLLEAYPSDPAVVSLGGIAALQAGNLNAAVELLGRSAAADPRNADTRNNLGLALLRSGLAPAAADHLRLALKLNPKLFAAAINLVFALIALGKLTEADRISRQVITKAGETTDALYARASVLAAANDLEGAVGLFKRAIALSPSRADLHGGLANAYLVHGYAAESLAAYTEAARLEPWQATWRQGLAAVGHAPESADEIRASLDQANEPAQRAGLAFAMARAFDDDGDYKQAFDSYLEANRLKRSTFTYLSEETAAIFDDIKQNLTAEFMRARDGSGHPDAAPIFIIGMPRSGTSLVEQILASHPDVHGAGELDLFRSTANQVLQLGTSPKIGNALARMPAEGFARIGSHYAAAVRALAGDKPRVTDKLPGNFLLAGAIALALPDAKIIHIRRDPMDNCVSIFRADFGALHKHAYDLMELADYYVHYRQLMQHWDAVLPPGRIYPLDYSALVADQEGETRRLLAHCDLEWSDACLRFYETKRPVRTVSALQVRKPIFDDSVGSAARYGDAFAPLRTVLERHGVASLPPLEEISSA